MQALSIWPSTDTFWVVSQVSLYQNPILRRSRWAFDGSFCHFGKCGLMLASSTSAMNIKWQTYFHKHDYPFSRCTNFRLHPRASVALELTPEQHSMTGEFVHDSSNSTDQLDKKSSKQEESGGVKTNGKVDVRLLARSLESAKTVEDVEAILKDKGDLPLQVYSSMIRGFGKEKMLDPALAIVRWLNKRSRESSEGLLFRPNLFIYNSLLGAVKQSEKFEQVEKVMKDMSKEGIQPNVVTYNTLMGIYLEQGREFEALNLFQEIETDGLSPSPASYSTALLAYRRLEDGFGALDLYMDIKAKYLNGSLAKDENWEVEFSKLENFTVRICYQVIRQWLVKNENLSRNVMKLLVEMDQAGLQTSQREYERLVWACTREEHYIVVKELYRRIRCGESEISLSVCNHVIWLMGKAKKWWAALEVYEDLLDKGPKPNNMSYELVVSHFNILLSAARRRGIWRWGISLLNKMVDKGLKPGSREWNAVLIACSKASETSAAVQIFNRMVENGDKPTIISYGALLSALEKGKLYDEAYEVWQHMIKVGMEPNLYAYTIMASIYTAQGKFNIVESIIREMISSGIEPTVVTFNAIISGCAHNNMGASAYEWFQRMKAQNISPNEVTYEMLILALAIDGKPRLAYEEYLRAQNEGLVLSSKAYDAIIQSSIEYGASIDLTILGPRPVEISKSHSSKASHGGNLHLQTDGNL
ncbi:protein LOW PHOTOSYNTHETIC EFFICIENCY 1, chloroplastic-like [Impatiens glandulifera]|uniref:protein LOW PHOTOSYNTHETIC EFFICIENCY 1, chloroplastic-like n=1 Tax=Impatiens glandulifera TaxID=253017 RepID=UPI001FB17DDE|nr:protein LOW PHOTOSYNTHETIC EFFICIENCY 1, chloroplastic-like [Impatiens glandulifera]